MPLTNAEKQKRYRERLKNNPEKKEEIRKKNLERIKTKTKKVKDMTEEEKNEKRRIWRNQKQKQKQKKNVTKKDEEIDRVKSTAKLTVRLRKISNSFKRSLCTIEKLNKTVAALRKKMYRQKLLFRKKIIEKNKEIEKLNSRVEETESVMKAIYTSSNRLIKRNIQNLVRNEKNRQKAESNKSFVGKCLGISRIRRYKKRGKNKSKKIQKEISEFFSRDDISRITAGKKECRTKHKDKQQIRYLTDTLSNLFKIYKSEGGQQSFTTFYKYKPFFILSPTLQSRDTCMCIKHSNMNFLLKTLISQGLIEYGTTIKDMLTRVTCDIYVYDCMYGKCLNCANLTTEFDVNSNKINDEVKWWWWQSKKHSYTKKDKNTGDDKEYHTRKTTKEVKKGTITELIQIYNKEIMLFKKHYFNMKTQQNQYRACVQQLKPHEVLLVCDYSENYNCKLHEEVQSMHFGASKQQVTLHCVMVFWKNKSQSMCTISESPCHEPAAILAHLMPVIRFIRSQSSDTKVLHIYSDGPTSQYRQKKNYFLLNMFIQKMKFDYATWSFTESGHGKGVADGIGGAVKRCLDRQVLYGHDIQNADDVFTNINVAMKSVKAFLIPVEEIDNILKIIPNNLRPISGNNEIHQIITTREQNTILHRPLSCFCGSMPGLCTCYFPKKHCLLHLHVDQRSADVTVEVFENSENKELQTFSHDIVPDQRAYYGSCLSSHDMT